AAVPDFDEGFFGGDGLARLAAWLEKNGDKAPLVRRGERRGPPICRPSKIICIGLNFRDHAAETGAELPEEPVIFFKSPTAPVGPNEPLVKPRGATKVDWEVELAVVVGKAARYVTEAQAYEHVAG